MLQCSKKTMLMFERGALNTENKIAVVVYEQKFLN